MRMIGGEASLQGLRQDQFLREVDGATCSLKPHPYTRAESPATCDRKTLASFPGARCRRIRPAVRGPEGRDLVGATPQDSRRSPMTNAGKNPADLVGWLERWLGSRKDDFVDFQAFLIQ